MSSRTPSFLSARSLRRGAAVVTALGLSLSLVACGGGDKKADKPAAQSTAGGRTMNAVWPLTGLPIKGDAPSHPVIVVKIPNTAEANPQVGMKDADLVTEELVEGGITRLAVAYDSKIPGTVGPVRSMRASDIGIVKPTRGVLVASGGAPPTVARMQSEHVKVFSEGAMGYYRDGGRRAPYNLFMKLGKLAKSLKAPAKAPKHYLPWGAASDWKGKGKATDIRATFSQARTSHFAYQRGAYVLQNSHAPRSQDFKPSNVLVLRVKVGDAGYRDPIGNPVPETKFTGTGSMVLFHGGKFIRGTWHKNALDSSLTLRTKAGPLKVPAGKTYVELVPNRNGKLTFS